MKLVLSAMIMVTALIGLGILITILVPQKRLTELNNLDNIELKSQIPGYKLRINNRRELLSLVLTMGTFWPNNGLDPVSGEVFTVRRLRVIAVPQPVEEKASYRVHLDEGLLELYIYISPDWLVKPQKLSQLHLLNKQFAQLIFATNNKNAPQAQQLLKNSQSLYTEIERKITIWEQTGAAAYPLSL